MSGKNTIGILTGGGDVPGLNSVIKSVVYRATEMGKNVVGIRKGWKGLTNVDTSETGESIYHRELTPGALHSAAQSREHAHHRPHRRNDFAHVAHQSEPRRGLQSARAHFERSAEEPAL